VRISCCDTGPALDDFIHGHEIGALMVKGGEEMRTFRSWALTAGLIWVFGMGTQLSAPAASAPAQGELDRTVLPIPMPVPALITEPDAHMAKMPAPFSVTAPKGAPNVPLVLIDDMGGGMTLSWVPHFSTGPRRTTGPAFIPNTAPMAVSPRVVPMRPG
jgi:hypothetical protein